MSRVLICMRCGHEGSDVDTALVDLEEEARREGNRVRLVEVELQHELRHVKETTTVVVPERYATERRCRDRVACEDRYVEQLRAEASAATTEEDVPWL